MTTLADVIVLHKPSHAMGICTCGATFADAHWRGAWWPDFANHLAEQVRGPVMAEAKAAGLREAADDIETDWAPVWGGDGMWFTTGTAVAELVAGTLRSMAQEVES